MVDSDTADTVQESTATSLGQGIAMHPAGSGFRTPLQWGQIGGGVPSVSLQHRSELAQRIAIKDVFQHRFQRYRV